MDSNLILVSKENLINLIRGHYEKDEEMFKKGAEKIQNEFRNNGDDELEEYIMALINPKLAWEVGGGEVWK